MKGNADCHVTNDAFRESYERIFKKHELSLDHTRCADDGCTTKDECLRFLCRADDVGGRWIVPSLFPYDISICDTCPMIIKIGEKYEKAIKRSYKMQRF